jgi:hypothetical protein
VRKHLSYRYQSLKEQVPGDATLSVAIEKYSILQGGNEQSPSNSSATTPSYLSQYVHIRGQQPGAPSRAPGTGSGDLAIRHPGCSETCSGCAAWHQISRTESLAGDSHVFPIEYTITSTRNITRSGLRITAHTLSSADSGIRDQPPPAPCGRSSLGVTFHVDALCVLM